ncbi:MAG: PilZ domain-containing protein [Smithellaceae bacterium]
MSDGLEKRKFQHLECPLGVTVDIVSAMDAPKVLASLHIKSRNISKGGICLETKAIEIEGINLLSGHPFARTHRLFMKIELIPNEQLFEAIGEVRWYDISSNMPESIYQVGVEFIDIKKTGKDQLLRFLKNHKSNKGYFEKLFQ